MKGMKLACVLLVACGGGESDSPRPGAFTLGWSITLDSAPALCEDVGGITVAVTTSGPTEDVIEFPCLDSDGATALHEPGTYEIVVELRDGANGSLFAFAPVEGEIVDGPADLGDFVFALGSTCDASTCATGCCDSLGDCIDPQTDMACGRGGATCSNCTSLAQVCNPVEGMCID
jgi:hypothetical protein